MIEKIALISPLDSFLSAGVRYLSAHLRANGIQTRVIFLPAYTQLWQQLLHQDSECTYTPEVLSQLRDLVADCGGVGITGMTMDKEKVKTIIGSLSPLNKPIILGGVHATAFPDDALSMANHVVIGEGEDPLLEWCQEPDRPDIPNVYLRRNGSVVRNEIRPARTDLDTLPFPDYGPDEHWILHRNKIKSLTPHLLGEFMGPMYHQFATRGCPFSCTFCINNRFKELGKEYRKFVYHGPEYIVSEIEYGLSLSPSVQYINFPDDGFIAMKEGPMAELAELYKTRIGLPFSVMGIIPSFLNERKLEILVDAGLKRVRLGFQSSSKSTLRFYKRPGDSELYRKCHGMIRRHPELVFPYYDVIGDNPMINGEEDMAGTAEFLASLNGPFTIFLYSLRMYPGTEIHEQARAEGVDDAYFDDSYFKFQNHLLNYTLTWLQCTNLRIVPRLLLALYRKAGNLQVPGFLFTVNKFLFMLRLGIEHLRKRDVSGLPLGAVKLGNLFGLFKVRRKTKRRQEEAPVPSA